MIITFTGAQSTGKSTLLKALQIDPAFKDWKFEAEITRSLKEKYKLSINEHGDDFTQIVTIHSHIDTYLRNLSNDAVFDRCAADAMIYTFYQYYTKGDISKELCEYAEFIFKKLYYKYDIIFYTDPNVPIEDDGVRSTDISFRNKIIELFEGLLFKDFPNKNVVRVHGTVEERLQIIKREVEKRKTPVTIDTHEATR